MDKYIIVVCPYCSQYIQILLKIRIFGCGKPYKIVEKNKKVNLIVKYLDTVLLKITGDKYIHIFQKTNAIT